MTTEIDLERLLRTTRSGWRRTFPPKAYVRRSNPRRYSVRVTCPSSRRAVQESWGTRDRAEDAGGEGQISLERSVHAIRFVEEMKLTIRESPPG